MTRVAISMMALVTCVAQVAWAGTCYVDDPNNQSGYVSPIQEGSGQELTSLCGHEVHGSSCVLQVTDNNNVLNSSSGADCLTLGAGVTVQMSGHTISCTGSNCGAAIRNTASGGSGSKVDIQGPGTITGCFQDAAVGKGTNAHIEDIVFDLAAQNGGQCSFPSFGTFNTGYAGLSGASENFKDATRIVVRNAQVGSLRGTAYLIDSLIHDCNVASTLLPKASGIVFTDNNYDIVDTSPDCTECVLRNVGVCHYYTNVFNIGCTNVIAPTFHGRTIVDDSIGDN